MTTRARPSRHVALAPGALRRAREDAGLSITALARQARLSFGHLAAVERGCDGISAPALARVVAVLDIRIADLRPERDDGPPAPA